MVGMASKIRLLLAVVPAFLLLAPIAIAAQSSSSGMALLASKPHCVPHGHYGKLKKHHCKPGGGVLGENRHKGGNNGVRGEAASQGGVQGENPFTGADIFPFVVIALLTIGVGLWLVLRRPHTDGPPDG